MQLNETEQKTNEARLESWKEIGAYLQRNAVTVRRWEKEEGLPVHRHSHKARASVYAYASEIDAWREARKVLPELLPPVPLWKTLFGTPRSWAFGLTMAMALVMVGNGLRPQAAEAAPPALKALCTEFCVDIGDGGVSRDGRFAIGTDWGVGDIVIQNLRSGNRRYVGVRAATDAKDAWPEFATFSRDDRQIAYLWSSAGNSGGEGMELRVIENKSGAKPRTLLKGFPNLTGLDWSADGRRLLSMLEEKKDEVTLAWVAVSDGSVQTVKALGKRLKQYAKVSPDGRFIAYSATPADVPGSKDERIYTLTADGRTEAEIVHVAGVNRDPVWSADGSHLVFMSDRTGKNSLWSVRIAEGKAAGPEKMLKADISNNFVAWGMTRDGSYIYQTTTSPVISTSIFAMESGGNRLAGTPPRILESFIGTNPAWSPDGKRVAFTRPSAKAKGLELVVRNVEGTTPERAYSAEGITADPPRWFPDGKSVMKNANLAESGERALYRFNLDTGAVSTIVRYKNEFAAGEGEISADGKTIFLAGAAPDGGFSRLMALDVATGSWRAVFASPVGGRNIPKIILHPDGTRLLLRIQVGETSHFATISVDGTGYREIYRTDAQVTGVAWTRDGAGVLFATRPESTWRVMRIPVTGGRPEPIGLDVPSDDSRVLLSLSPDGTRLAASSRKLMWEIQSLEHLESALK